MKCGRCGKEAYQSTTSEAIELGFGVLVIRNIPCYKCKECDEVFYTGDVVEQLERITERVRSINPPAQPSRSDRYISSFSSYN